MHLSHRLALGPLFVVIGAFACREPLAPLPPCGTNTVITVGVGLQPELSWTPRCRVATVAVSGPSSLIWLVRTADSSLAPPIRLGSGRAVNDTGRKRVEVVGSGATLLANGEYRANLNQWTATYSAEKIIATLDFTVRQ